jgi:hypothetical protein
VCVGGGGGDIYIYIWGYNCNFDEKWNAIFGLKISLR